MGGDHRRFPRVKQKGVECSVEGCTDWCVGRDLCPKHNMALYRYGSVDGKPKTKKICVVCGKEFKHKYDITKYCSPKCYQSTPEYKAKLYEGVKKHRAKFPEKNRARDRTNKRITRDKTLERQPCEVCGEENAEAHHYNYDHPLNINWLCKKHHRHEHMRLQKIKKELINA